MRYQIISPIFTQIDSDTLADAIKMFVKVNYANQIRNLVITDQMNKYNASINYYNNNNRNKIGISIEKDTGYTVYPSNSSVQPIYKEHDDGTSSEIVGMGLQVPLRPVKIEPSNTIKVTPMITAPGLISTTNSGIVSAVRYLSNL
jgi:hypothetical protein